MENPLRRKLATIRDEAIELAAMLEFSLRSDVSENDLWKWAIKLITETEQIMTNSRGELDLDKGD